MMDDHKWNHVIQTQSATWTFFKNVRQIAAKKIDCRDAFNHLFLTRPNPSRRINMSRGRQKPRWLTADEQNARIIWW